MCVPAASVHILDLFKSAHRILVVDVCSRKFSEYTLFLVGIFFSVALAFHARAKLKIYSKTEKCHVSFHKNHSWILTKPVPGHEIFHF